MLNYANASLRSGTHSNHSPKLVAISAAVDEIAVWPEKGRFLGTCRKGCQSPWIKAKIAPIAG